MHVSVSTQPSLMSTCIDWFNLKVLDPLHMKKNHFNFIVGYYNSLDGPIINIWTIDFLKTFFYSIFTDFWTYDSIGTWKARKG